MAMKYCPECGHARSKTDFICPNCGHTLRNSLPSPMVSWLFQFIALGVWIGTLVFYLKGFTSFAILTAIIGGVVFWLGRKTKPR
jgi:hypothetical protein